ncbi:hypothetical protein F4813DRAFT_358838 [Daldinia decipiens]|uniref:uncharacterized protein n=1 Tax=Daldinia decipiens TaxID=326647 RepID=UPI0020C4DD12|nr:uncharacterized protein F4813DRAFT_358838 [Daldinia decipiens]KAI1658034.1 hypothetical protein F4813DRAFT_358838 [Daldinia decipiens]
MLFSTISLLAIVALAGQAIAEPIRQPYKPKLAHMSPRAIFGLDRRADGGYAPAQQFCEDGNTCAEACGKGFEQCASKDNVVHCFNQTAQQTCCPGKTGESCDKGFFCTADDKGATWCCPDNMTLEQCADAYNLPGSLVTQTSPSTTKPKSSPTSTTLASTTTAKSVSTSAKAAANTTSTRITTSPNTTTSQASESSTSVAPASTAPASITPAPETTAAPATPSPTPSSTIPANGIATAGSDSNYGSINSIMLLAVAAFAVLL